MSALDSRPLVVSPMAYPFQRASRVYERNVVAYRRGWLVLLSGFFEPVFYLLSLGIGLGALVGAVPVHGHAVPYREFVAPAMLASSAMNGALYDATFNVFHKIKYMKTYDAVLATPLGVLDIAVGEVAWSLTRGLIYSSAFLVMTAALGLVHSWWGLLALPAASLVGFAFAAAGMAVTSYLRSWQDFDWVQLVVLPMFLFSATFYPIERYPEGARWLVDLTPLYHGVALLRELTLGQVGLASLAHVAVLVALGVVGLVLTRRRLAHRLLR